MPRGPNGSWPTRCSRRRSPVSLAPMPPVAIVADSTLYTPRALVEANDIGVVSLYVNED